MKFFDRLFGKKPPTNHPKENPFLDAVTFDLSDCELQLDEEIRRLWISTKRVAHMLRYNHEPPDWTWDLRDAHAADDFYGKQCAEAKGVMLYSQVQAVDGIELLHGIFKYRGFKDKPGMMYASIIWLPFADRCWQLNIEALETGTTGIREAVVMLEEPGAWPENPAPPIKVESGEDLFAKMAAMPAVQSVADDEKYDAKFPDHPLSLVRSRLKKVLATLAFDSKVKELKPFRAG